MPTNGTPTPTTGSISVSSSPSGAIIHLGESYVGTTPSTLTNIAPGSYVITLALSGYEFWGGTTVNVVAGQTSYVSASLIPAPSTTGSISVSSSPSGAQIFLDGNYYGLTPWIIPSMNPGSYTITLRIAGYQDFQQTINVVAGQTSYVSPSLIRLP